MKTPREIDEWMWLVAEDGSSEAVREFERRYPGHTLELHRRLEMMERLRKVGRARSLGERPRFAPRMNRPAPWQWMGGLACLLLIGGVSYFATLRLSTKAKALPAPASMAHTSPWNETPPQTGGTPVTANMTRVASPAEPTPNAQNTVRMEAVELRTALELLAAQGQIRLQFAPDMPNPTIRFSYTGYSTMEMLEDLGRHLGFTPFDQGDGTILIVPAIDPNRRLAQAHGGQNGEVAILTESETR